MAIQDCRFLLPVRLRDVVIRPVVYGFSIAAVGLSAICFADEISYGYDAAGRVTSISVAGQSAYYDYDAAGNMIAIRREVGVASIRDATKHDKGSPLPTTADTRSSRAVSDIRSPDN